MSVSFLLWCFFFNQNSFVNIFFIILHQFDSIFNVKITFLDCNFRNKKEKPLRIGLEYPPRKLKIRKTLSNKRYAFKYLLPICNPKNMRNGFFCIERITTNNAAVTNTM